MSVIEITSIDMLNQIIDACKLVGKFLIIKASANWCQPCKAVKPKYLQMAEKYQNIAVFVEFDVDNQQEIAEQFQISSMPTFIVVKNNNVIKKTEGTDLFGVLSILENTSSI
jgi:thioredoxin 1